MHRVTDSISSISVRASLCDCDSLLLEDYGRLAIASVASFSIHPPPELTYITNCPVSSTPYAQIKEHFPPTEKAANHQQYHLLSPSLPEHPSRASAIHNDPSYRRDSAEYHIPAHTADSWVLVDHAGNTAHECLQGMNIHCQPHVLEYHKCGMRLDGYARHRVPSEETRVSPGDCLCASLLGLRLCVP